MSVKDTLSFWSAGLLTKFAFPKRASYLEGLRDRCLGPIKSGAESCTSMVTFVTVTLVVGSVSMPTSFLLSILNTALSLII